MPTSRGPLYLHRVLIRIDKASAAKIHANDTAKLIRAIEVCLASRRRMSELWQENGRDPLRGFRILRIGLNPPRAHLYERINLRAQQMFDDGLVEETQNLLERFGSGEKVMALDSLGYRQAAQLLRGELTREQAITAAQQGHRNYAKRQMTWFRREPEVTWLEGFGDDPSIEEQAGRVSRGRAVRGWEKCSETDPSPAERSVLTIIGGRTDSESCTRSRPWFWYCPS